MAIDIFAVGETGCSCTCESSYFPLTCKGCNSILFPSGQSIQVWTALGGTLINTFTTNSSGVAYFTGLNPGAYWIIPSNARFAGQTITIGTGSTNISFGAASGYTCSTLCYAPLANTLNGTFSVIGAVTLTYGSTIYGAGWKGTSGAYEIDILPDLTTYYQHCVNGGGSAGALSSCPPSFSMTITAFDGCLTSIGNGIVTE